MSSSVRNAEAETVEIIAGELVVHLKDGRTISAPTKWFPRLANASSDQLSNWRLIGTGEGIHWPDLDEDVSVEGLLRGQ